MHDAREAGASEWYVVGLLSSGVQGEACGTGYYTKLAANIAWLEQESGRDLTPCFTGAGEWSPSDACRDSTLDDEGVPASLGDARASSVCGPAYAVGGSSSCQAVPGSHSNAAASVPLVGFVVLAFRRRRLRPC